MRRTMQTRMPSASGQFNHGGKRDEITQREAASIEEAKMAKLLLQDSLTEASNIQQTMLPTEPLRLPFVEICHRFRPARTVSGDFLDYFALGPQNLAGLYVGDTM